MNWWPLPFAFAGSIGVVSCIYFSIIRARRARKFSPFSEPSLRLPGHSLKQRLDDMSLDFLFHLMLASIFPVLLALILFYDNSAGTFIVVLIGTIAVFHSFYRIITDHKQIQMTRLGYQGEVYTGQELNCLMRLGAYVYHDVPYRYGNIDHVVISKGGVFAVETKAFRKFSNAKGQRNSRLTVADNKINVGGFSTSQPIKQAEQHSRYLAAQIKSRLGITCPVTAVVALPGWYITIRQKIDCLVINPKGGRFLEKPVSQTLVSEDQVDKIARLIEEYCRSVEASSDITDSDANKKYDLWLNRRKEEAKL